MNLSISHKDLDGTWCQLLLRKVVKDIQFIRHSYKNLDQCFDNIQYNRYDTVYISDLDTQDINLSSKNIMLFDHHYNNKTVNTIFDSDKSASKIIDDYYNINNDLTNYVNAFDIWDIDSKYFEYGFILNCWFWTKGDNMFFNRFSQNEDISDIITWYNDIHKVEVLEYFEKLEKKGLIIRGDNIILCFTDIHQHWISYLYDYNYTINTTSYGRIIVKSTKMDIPEITGFKGSKHTKVFQGSVLDSYDLIKTKEVVELLEGIE